MSEGKLFLCKYLTTLKVKTESVIGGVKINISGLKKSFKRGDNTVILNLVTINGERPVTISSPY